jgi:predicted DNA-binding WGR domain protein
VLRRVDPEHGMARFYMLAIERDLFGTIRLVRTWGRIGTRGCELADVFETEEHAAEALERLVAVKRRRGYQDL